MLRYNPHFHALALEGGFDDKGTLFYIPFSGLQLMVEVFRRRVIKLLVARELLNKDVTRNLLSWKHSGFSIYDSVRVLDEYFKENLHMFDALDFLVELTQHIPPKRLQLIRRYGC